MADQSLTWFVVHSRPRQEGDADAQLRQLGYETFYPFERVKRRRKLPHGKVRLEEVELPHFPRYLFVGLEEGQSLYHVNNAAAVSTVLYLGPQPLRVPEAVIDALIEACDDSGAIIVKDTTKRPPFEGKPGDNVQFLEGPFAGFIGCIATIDTYDKTGRIKAWLDILGSTVPVETIVDHVKLIGKKACA